MNCSRALENLHDLGGDDVWRGRVGGVFEGFAFEPEDEDIEVVLVAFDEVVVGEALEALAFFSFKSIQSQSGGGVPPSLRTRDQKPAARRWCHFRGKNKTLTYPKRSCSPSCSVGIWRTSSDKNKPTIEKSRSRLMKLKSQGPVAL